MQDSKKSKIPQHLQMDTVSPATRLLEKRRVMYEVQEAFEVEKKNFKKKESSFKKREMDLRNKDFEIQERLLKFSKYLQDNEAKKKRAEGRAKEEEKAVEDFKKEINKKKSELLDLKEKSNRIEKKVQAMKKYEDLLERVKNEYPDEFPELNDILNRYNTLYESNTRLKDQQTSMEKDLNSTRLQKTDYDKQKTNEILSLNNKIAIFQKNLEERDEQKNDLQKQVEVSTSTARGQSSQLGKILMAVDNLYHRCLAGGSTLKYRIDEDPKNIINFDNFTERGKIAKKQLDVISLYLADFGSIIKICEITNMSKAGGGMQGFTETNKQIVFHHQIDFNIIYFLSVQLKWMFIDFFDDSILLIYVYSIKIMQN